MIKIYAMACVILDDKNRILILKRASDKKFFPAKWSVVAAAPLRKSTVMEKIALQEIKDELGVEGNIIKKGNVIEMKLNGVHWIISPFSASISSSKIILNKEHTEAKWVYVEELKHYDLVPGLSEAINDLI